MAGLHGPSTIGGRGRACLTDLEKNHASFFVPACSINLRTLFVGDLDAPQEALARDGKRSAPFTDNPESSRIFLVGWLDPYQTLLAVKVESDVACSLEVELFDGNGI